MSAVAAKTNRETIAAAAARWVARHDAGLSPAEKGEFERWLAADALHRSAWEHYRSAWAVLDRPGSAGQGAAVLQQVTARKRQRARRRLGAAAGVALIALAVLWWPGRARVEPVPTNAIVHRPAVRALPDGSRVELKPGAEIAVDFSGADRRVRLAKGTAHFSVAKDPARPFVVTAAGVETRAVGTAFTVQLESRDVEVIVTEGRVTVAGPVPAGQSPVEPASVEAGKRLTVTLGGPAETPAEVSPREMDELLAWRSPRLEFSDTPLREAIVLMNQYGGAPGKEPALRLEIDPASVGLGEESVTGLFRADQAEAFVRMLEVSLGMHGARRGDVIVLRRGK